MFNGHWGSLVDFIISRLQSYILFLMKMLEMSTFGNWFLLIIGTIIYIFWTFDNCNNYLYFLDIAGKDYLMAGFC